jgi:ribosomal protein S18 acetylase RimI-like enzyme
MSVRPATAQDVPTISRICADAWRATYQGIYLPTTIENVIARYYDVNYIAPRIQPQGRGWLGWLVATDEHAIVRAAGGGGMIGRHAGELFVLYAEPGHRDRGYGSAILALLTEHQQELGAREQWVSVAKGNDLGLPFYRSRGFTFIEEVQPWDGTGSAEGVNFLRLMRELGPPRASA